MLRFWNRHTFNVQMLLEVVVDSEEGVVKHDFIGTIRGGMDTISLSSRIVGHCRNCDSAAVKIYLTQVIVVNNSPITDVNWLALWANLSSLVLSNAPTRSIPHHSTRWSSCPTHFEGTCHDSNLSGERGWSAISGSRWGIHITAHFS